VDRDSPETLRAKVEQAKLQLNSLASWAPELARPMILIVESHNHRADPIVQIDQRSFAMF